MTDNVDSEIKLLRERYEKSPESRLFAPLADAYRKSGDVDRAIELCEEGLRRHPDYASAHVILGKCFYDKGATERSRAEFERVIEIDPENMVGLKYMGDIMVAEGRNEDATGFYKRLLAIDPTNEEITGILKGLEEEFNSREIDLSKTDTIERTEHSGELATMTLAGIYAAQGYYDKALRMYREIEGKQPDSDEARRMIEKIESILESSEKERAEVFEDEVMTISLDEVGEDIVENTSGGGMEGEAQRKEEEPAPADAADTGIDDQDELQKVAMELEEEDRIEAERESGKKKTDEGARGEDKEGFGHFRKWLEKMKEDGKE
jgi:tetratricopeptide (TPR) repeat protein